MMRNLTVRGSVLAATVLWVAPELTNAQSLAERIAAARDEVVTFHYTARPGVCGDGESFIRTGDHSYHGNVHVGRAKEPCVAGPVQVRLMLDAGGVFRLQYWVGPLRHRGGRDLGRVPAREAASYLMTIAQRGTQTVSAKAIFPAVLADSAVVWPALLTVARDVDTRSRGTRQEALMFLSRFASAAVAGHPNEPFAEHEGPATEDEGLKTQAVFVLSQLPRNEGVPELLKVARENRSWRVRSQALFWLGQSGDPRALELFEALLKS